MWFFEKYTPRSLKRISWKYIFLIISEHLKRSFTVNHLEFWLDYRIEGRHIATKNENDSSQLDETLSTIMKINNDITHIHAF